MDKIASQIKVLLLFGMVGGVSLSLRKNEVGIRWKDNALIRGGLTDMTISCFYESHGVKLAVRSQQTP